MKLTLEPTEDLETYSTCSISCSSDGLTIEEMFDKLIIPALLAMEFSQGSIDKYLDNE